MFFNFFVHNRVVSDAVGRVFAFLDSPQERRWVAMGAFVLFLILGAGWVSQARVLPGVSSSETGLPGPILDIEWDASGTEALALVDLPEGPTLMARDADGSWIEIECECNATAIGGSTSDWVIGGEEGWFGVMLPGSTLVRMRSLNWSSAGADIISLDGDIDSGWLIAEHEGGNLAVHTWSGLELSNGTAAPLSSIVLTEVEEVSGGALLIGHDLAGGNPAGGATTEVLLDGAVTVGEAPHLDLLHLGAGQPFHTILPAEDGPWGQVFVAIVGGGDATYGVEVDRSVTRIPGAPGSVAIALDEQGTLWFSGEAGITTLGTGDSEAQEVILPDDMGEDVTSAYRAGENIVLMSADGAERVTIDPNAQNSVLHSLSLLGDLVLVLILIAFVGFGGYALLRKHDVL